MTKRAVMTRTVPRSGIQTTSLAWARGPLLLLLLLLAWSGCDTSSIPGGQFDAGGGGPLGFGCNTTADCARTDGSTLECCLGRCTDTTIDPRHCGGCNMGCPAIPNAASIVCNAGTCAVGVCAPGFADCDAVGESGCEIDLTIDNANCGRCGGRCGPGPHSMASCGGARCRVTCEIPFADCNGVIEDGCEVDLNVTIGHCGACGNACPNPANAAPGCSAGRCGVGGCLAGFGNCDLDGGNGCETNLFTSLDHCGGCGRGCGGPNAVGVCQSGVCGLLCNAGFADCNKLSGDGCESQLSVDRSNCGLCGNACGINQSCVGGVCGGAFYAPVGPQSNVPLGSLVGWAQCFVDPYSGVGASTAQLQAMCPKAKLMLACRKVGANQLTSLAWAPRADVLFDTGNAFCQGASLPHQANGTGFYFNGATSWGFAAGGETVDLCTCDTGMTSADKRTCWHANGGMLTGGYRCGATLSLNNDATWERLIFHAD